MVNSISKKKSSPKGAMNNNYHQYYTTEKEKCQMEITLTDTDGIRFQAATALIKEFHARGDHTEIKLFDGSRFHVRETPEEIYKTIMEARNETA